MAYEPQNTPVLTNTSGTSGGSVTVGVPRSPRERREAKALAVVRSMRPSESPQPVFVPYVPPRPEATFTYYGRPNDTFISGSVVYFLYSSGRIKIGISNGLRGRLMGLQKSGAYPPVLLLVIDGGKKEERDLHLRFHEDRLHGEWFTCSPKLRSFIRIRLCEVGLHSLDKAEEEFKNSCEAYIAAYRKPPKRPSLETCAHGIPSRRRCFACDRDRALLVLESLRDGTYEISPPKPPRPSPNEIER